VAAGLPRALKNSIAALHRRIERIEWGLFLIPHRLEAFISGCLKG
jgi:hypothetical protein